MALGLPPGLPGGTPTAARRGDRMRARGGCVRRLLLLSLMACGDAVDAPVATPEVGPSPGEPVALATPAEAFAAAEEAAGVPRGLLAALARVHTGVQMVQPLEEHPGRPGRCGVLGLPVDLVAEAAARAGVGEHAACHTLDAHLRAGAFQLAAWAAEAGVAADGHAAWAPVVARWGGVAHHPEAAAEQVARVYDALRGGVRVEGALLGKVDVVPDFAAPVEAGRRGVDFASAKWRASPNFNSRGSFDPELVIIHTCEGAYSGCWSWLVNSGSGVSAHYVVDEAGSEVSQLVAEANRAWHISATYDCKLNSNTRCDLSGVGSNSFTIGIEHGGSASQTSFSTGQIQTSAELLCDITRRQGIPLDAYHVVAHGQLQPANRIDPGPNWPWSDYLRRAKAACGGGGPVTPPAGQRIIDSNNAANPSGDAEMVVSSAWVSSANVSGYWNTGYYVAPTEAVSDPAHFRFRTTAPTCYTVEAWWTAATDRAPNATFLGWNAAGAEVGRRSVDQRGLGSQWVTLGDWLFTTGWNEVVLSRWTTPGAYVVADAVRLTPSTACPGGGGGPPDPCSVDSDGDGANDCVDQCPSDPAKAVPGACGCGVSDADADGDGVASCDDNCPGVFNPAQRDADDDSVGDACDPDGGDTAWDPGATGDTSTTPDAPDDTDTGSGGGSKPPGNGGGAACAQGGAASGGWLLLALLLVPLRRRR
ncbi:MAG: N-acetylmuramoyl-L-alanine amidase [Alphaproteobacteria bacterium]|nr:N-acetylmuramoyl-L-alanine amidase [Alphaproteobacteria bacterium]